MVNVAFTGPTSPNREMREALKNYIRKLPEDTIVISGGAVGVDTIVAQQAAISGLGLRLVVPKQLWWNKELVQQLRMNKYQFELIQVPGEYRDRNERMVALCDRLVACLWKPEFYRSGEWMTVNIARRAGVEIKAITWRN